MPAALTIAMQILMEVIAAAPGVESTVEEAVHAWHQSGSSTPEKLNTLAAAAAQLGSTAGAIAQTFQPPAA